MAEEQKSRLSGIVGLLTAISGLIAALVALSGVLKPLFDQRSGNASAATGNIAGLTGNTVDVAMPAGRSRPSSSSAAPFGTSSGRNSEGSSAGSAAPFGTSSGPNSEGGAGTAAEGGTSVTHDPPSEASATIEPASHHEAPAETPMTDHPTTHESE